VIDLGQASALLNRRRVVRFNADRENTPVRGDRKSGWRRREAQGSTGASAANRATTQSGLFVSSERFVPTGRLVDPQRQPHALTFRCGPHSLEVLNW